GIAGNSGDSDDRMARHGGMRGSFCPRHWAGHYESDKFVRAIFHDETGRLRNWSGPEPSNRGSARRFFDLGESSRAWLRSAFALAQIMVRKKHQAPSTKLQAPEKHQAPNINAAVL